MLTAGEGTVTDRWDRRRPYCTGTAPVLPYNRPVDPGTFMSQHVRLAGGRADGSDVVVPRSYGTTIWVTVIDGAAHVLDIWDDAGLRHLLQAAPWWERYDRTPDREGPLEIWRIADS